MLIRTNKDRFYKTDSFMAIYQRCAAVYGLLSTGQEIVIRDFPAEESAKHFLNELVDRLNGQKENLNN